MDEQTPAGPRRTGTQSIERTVQLMKAVADRGGTGWQLADLARRCEMDKSTAHRILNCLVRERMVEQRPGGRYLPGPVMFELGLGMRGHQRFRAVAEERLTALAARTGLTAALHLHSGDETVCAYSVGQGATHNSVKMSVGHRRPLLGRGPGIAILLALPEQEAQAIVKRNCAVFEREADARLPAYLAMYRDSVAAGLALHESHWMPRVNAYAMAILDSKGKAFAALTLSGTADELPLTRRPVIEAILREEASYLSAQATTLGAVAPRE